MSTAPAFIYDKLRSLSPEARRRFKPVINVPRLLFALSGEKSSELCWECQQAGAVPGECTHLANPLKFDSIQVAVLRMFAGALKMDYSYRSEGEEPCSHALMAELAGVTRPTMTERCNRVARSPRAKAFGSPEASEHAKVEPFTCRAGFGRPNQYTPKISGAHGDDDKYQWPSAKQALADPETAPLIDPRRLDRVGRKFFDFELWQMLLPVSDAARTVLLLYRSRGLGRIIRGQLCVELKKTDQAEVAFMTGLCERTVRSAHVELEQIGVLEVETGPVWRDGVLVNACQRVRLAYVSAARANAERMLHAIQALRSERLRNALLGIYQVLRDARGESHCEDSAFYAQFMKLAHAEGIPSAIINQIPRPPD